MIYLKDIKKYICNGTYIINGTGDLIVKQGSKFELNATYSQKMNIFRRKTKENTFLNEDGENVFNAEVAIISSNKKSCKLINFQNKLFLTVYDSELEKNKIFNKKSKYLEAYNIRSPKIIKDDKRSITEEFIENKPFDASDAFTKIIVKMFEFKDISNLDAQDEIYHFTKQYNIHFQIPFKKGVPFVLAHGDFWSSNIIYNETYYLTDFEHVGHYYFLYDFMTYIFNELLLNKKDNLIKKYVGGVYDKELSNTFKQLDLEYNPNHKKEYFLLFLAFYNKNRWNKKSTKLFMYFYIRWILRYFN